MTKKTKKNLWLKIGISTLTGIVVGSTAAGVAVTLSSCTQTSKTPQQETIDHQIPNKKPNVNEKQVIFDNQKFKSKKAALDYALKLVKNQKIDSTNQNLWSVNLNNQLRVFDDSEQLIDFIDKQIKPIETITDVTNPQLDPVDHSILSNTLIDYNLDLESLETTQPKYVDVYKTKDDNFTTTLDSYNRDDNKSEDELKKDAENRAKDTYLEIHRAYYFNNIYFKSKLDLEKYLRTVYIHECVNQNKHNTDTYRRIEIPKTNGITKTTIKSNPIDFSDKNKNLENQVKAFLESNANTYYKIKIVDKNEPYMYINYIDDDSSSISNQISEQLVPVSSLPVIGLQANHLKPLYYVDAKDTEKYNFYGPNFIETDASIDSITNKSLWKNIGKNADLTPILKSQVIDIVASFLNLFLLDENVSNWSQKPEVGEVVIDKNNQKLIVKDGCSLFSFPASNKDKNNPESQIYKLNELEANMYQEMKKVYVENNNTLLDMFKKMVKTFETSKNYSVFYAIPVYYTWLIEKIAANKLPTNIFLAVKKYFLEVCSIITELFRSLFGDDLLHDYNYIPIQGKPGNTTKENELFDFAEFFGIGQYNFNGNDLGIKLSGIEFSKKYKQLLAACYVFILAMTNVNNEGQIKYDVATDEKLLKLISDMEGTDEEQDVTPDKIKEKFNNKIRDNHSLNKTTFTTFERLQAIYDNFSSLKDKFDNKFCSIIKRVEEQNPNIDKEPYSNFFNDKIVPLLNETINNVDTVNDVIKEFQNKIGVNNDLIIKKTHESTSKEILKQKFKATEKLHFKSRKDIFSSYLAFVEHDEITDDTAGQSINFLMKNGYKKEKLKADIKSSLKAKSKNKFIKNAKTVDEITISHGKGFGKVLQKINDAGFKVSKLLIDTRDLGKYISDNSDFYPDDIKAQMIASCALNIVSSICNILENIPGPVGLVFKVIGIVASFISGLIGHEEQEIYKFSIKDSDGKHEYSYYWDGGLIMKRFFGLYTEKIRGIDDLQIQNPIQITYGRSDDKNYFNGKFYTITDSFKLKDDAFKWLIQNNVNLESCDFQKVYSLKLNESIQGKSILNETNTFNNIDELFEQLKDAYNNSNNIFASNLVKMNPNEILFDNFFYKNEEEFENNLKKQIIDPIKHIYIAKLPELDNAGFPLPSNQQKPFKLPFPYYDPSKNNFENIVDFENKESKEISSQKMKYIFSNEDNANLKDELLLENIKNVFRNSFNVESKRILKKSIIGENTYSNLKTSINTQILYSVKLPISNINQKETIKFFINKNDAYKYIVKICNNGTDYENVDFRLANQTNDLLIYKQNNQDLYFKNRDDFLQWFNSQIKEIE